MLIKNYLPLWQLNNVPAKKALQARNAGSDYPPVSFKPFEEAYKALSKKLLPMVYELGFLKV